jgi:hypothetical protein
MRVWLALLGMFGNPEEGVNESTCKFRRAK